jgi:hypothetical protein
MSEFALRNFYVSILFVVRNLKYVFVKSIQGVAIGRSLMDARIFLMRSKVKERSLARKWFMKRRVKCRKNI